jgi:hypothetical protein
MANDNSDESKWVWLGGKRYLRTGTIPALKIEDTPQMRAILRRQHEEVMRVYESLRRQHSGQEPRE